MKIIFLDNKNIKDFIKKVKKNKKVCLDTEFDKTTSYYGKLALIQFAIDEKTAYIYDPITEQGLKIKRAIGKIFKNKKILKIIHAGRQDIEVISYFFKTKIIQMFDTQIMSKMLKIERQISYSNLVKMIFNVEISKKYQYTKWLKRPMKEEQILYAAKDVIYIPIIYQKFIKENNENLIKNCIEKTKDEIEKSNKGKDVEKQWRKFISKNEIRLNTKQTELLKKLFLIREEVSKKQNILPKILMKDKKLIIIQRQKPITIKHLEGIIKHIDIENKYKKAIIKLNKKFKINK